MFVFAYLIFREDVLQSTRFIRSLTARDANDAALSLLTLIALVQVSQIALISKRTAFHFLRMHVLPWRRRAKMKCGWGTREINSAHQNVMSWIGKRVRQSQSVLKHIATTPIY
jgi:hypothetical protein